MSAVPYVDLAAQHAPLKERILEAIGRVLDHGQFILGPEVGQLEAALRSYLGAGEVIGVGSGTDALVIALSLADVGEGDEVLVPSHTFFATASAVVLAGARPVFVDVDLDTMLLCPRDLRRAISPRTRAVVAVHLCGGACDLREIGAVCEEHGLRLIEDCAQSIGTKLDNRCVGTFGLGAFSFHPLKTLAACGDAGFVTVPSAELAARARRLRNLGLVDRDRCDEVSRHSRLDTLQAAILLQKLPLLDGWIAARRAHAARYDERLTGFVRQRAVDGAEHTFTNYVIRHPRRDLLRDRLGEAGFDTKVHYPVPIHRQRAFSQFVTRPLPNTERLVDEILSLPVSPELTEDQRERLIDTLLAIQ